MGVLAATVVELGPSTLVLRFGDDDATTTWTRVDMGVTNATSPIVGIWKTVDPEIYLVLANDGAAQLFGQADECQQDRPKNSQGCVLTEASTTSIAIDGDLSDWDPLGAASRLSDPSGDYQGDDAGADLAGLAAVYDGTSLYVLMSLHAAPSESFQGRGVPESAAYRITIQGYNGLSLSAEAGYSPENQTWGIVRGSSEISLAAGDTGIEWSADISSYVGEGFEQIDFIMVEPIDCGIGNCEQLDTMDCAYLPVM